MFSAQSSNAYKCVQFWPTSELEQARITFTVSLSVCVVGLSALFALALGALMASFMVVVGFVLMLCTFCTALLRWNEVRYRKKGLPPGTMGWPIIGETTEFLKQGPNFMKNQRAR